MRARRRRIDLLEWIMSVNFFANKHTLTAYTQIHGQKHLCAFVLFKENNLILFLCFNSLRMFLASFLARLLRRDKGKTTASYNKAINTTTAHTNRNKTKIKSQRKKELHTKQKKNIKNAREQREHRAKKEIAW